MDCRSNGLQFREFKDTRVKWLLPNEGTDALTIGEAPLNWPEMNGQLKKMKLGVMNKRNRIPQEHKDFHDGNSYYMSGTSQSAAVVSGIVALLLEAEPGLTPDHVKCKLMSSTSAAAPTRTPTATTT